jgi:hypothetical protein
MTDSHIAALSMNSIPWGGQPQRRLISAASFFGSRQGRKSHFFELEDGGLFPRIGIAGHKVEVAGLGYCKRSFRALPKRLPPVKPDR